MLVKTTVYWDGIISDEPYETVDTGVVEVIFRGPDGTATTGEILEYDVKDVKELVIHKRVVTES